MRTIFQFAICFITWRLISTTCEELDDNVCVLWLGSDNFLHLCTERHESHTCLTLANNSPIMEKRYLMVTPKSNNHCISALCNLVGRTYLMVTLKSINHCISAFCNLVGRTYLMVTLKSNNNCISAFCNLVGRIYLMVTLNSNNHCVFFL